MKSIVIILAMMLSSVSAAQDWPTDFTPVQQAKDIPVLMYHRISVDGLAASDMDIQLLKFKEQMKWLHDNGYKTISVDELVKRMQNKWTGENKNSRLSKAVVITFDDGWRNQLQAIPTLDKYNFKASFTIVSSNASNHNLDKWTANNMLDWDEINWLKRNPNYEILNHSKSHLSDPGNTMIDWLTGKKEGFGKTDVEKEFTHAREAIFAKTRTNSNYFVWPGGWYNQELLDMAKKNGFVATLTIDQGVNSSGDDVMKIKRLYIDGSCNLEEFESIMTKFITKCSNK